MSASCITPPLRKRLSFDLTPLAHPWWWGALALLIVNDNVFKGGGVVPGWLTGKLSDFAFVIVAPVLLAAFLPLAVRGRRTVAFVCVVGLYTAADLSVDVSDAVVRLARRAGLVWRLWPDRGDLIALAVSPLTIWLMRRPSSESGGCQGSDNSGARRTRFCEFRQRVGLMVGALACVATSALPRHHHYPFFVNGTTVPVEVRFTWVLRSTPCDTTTAANLAATLTSGDLAAANSVSVASGEVAALDGAPPAAVSPAGQCQVHQGWADQRLCVAAIVEAPGATPVVMLARSSWLVSEQGAFISCSSPPAPVSECRPKLKLRPDFGPDALALVELKGRPAFVAGIQIDIAPVDVAAVAARSVAPDACGPLLQTYTALTSATTCQTDPDCQIVRALPLRQFPPLCFVYVNASVNASVVDARAEQWRQSCVVSSATYCPPPQPAVCRGGTCGETCPGVTVPTCPYPCSINAQGFPCGNEGMCLDHMGKICECVGSVVVCKAPPPTAPDCPLGCLIPIPDLPPVGVNDAGTDSDGPAASDADASTDGDAAVAPDAAPDVVD